MAAININNLINLLQTIQKEQNPTKIIRIRLRDAVDNDRTDEKNLLMLALDFLKKQPDLTTLEDWPPQQFTFALFTWLQSKACTHKDKNTLAIDCLGQYRVSIRCPFMFMPCRPDGVEFMNKSVLERGIADVN
jgi:hypothetical protein